MIVRFRYFIDKHKYTYPELCTPVQKRVYFCLAVICWQSDYPQCYVEVFTADVFPYVAFFLSASTSILFLRAANGALSKLRVSSIAWVVPVGDSFRTSFWSPFFSSVVSVLVLDCGLNQPVSIVLPLPLLRPLPSEQQR